MLKVLEETVVDTSLFKMENKIKYYEENRKLQNQMITHLQEIVETLKDNKFKLAEDLEEKDQIMFKIKKKEGNTCPNNCEKYSKSIDEIF